MKKTIRISEKKLNSIIDKTISEAPVDYGDRPERMDPRLERKLADPENPYAKALKGGTGDVERLVGARFKKVVDKLRDATGIQRLTPDQLQNLILGEMMGDVGRTISIESGNKEQLEALAKKICLDETEVDEDWFKIEAFLNREAIDTSDFKINPSKKKPQFKPSDNFEADKLTDEELFELEKSKRHIINAIIQGTAKRGHYIFQKPEVKAELDAIDPSLYPMYLKIMAANDMMYFSMEQLIEMASQTASSVAGKVKIESDDDAEEDEPDTTIKAHGLIFPILCHEIIKGIEEAKGRHGLPKDMELAQDVMGQTDSLSQEPMQLRIGPEIVEKIRFALPAEIFEPENKGLINWFQTELYELPAKEFIEIISNVVSENEADNRKGIKIFNELLKKAKEKKGGYDDFKPDNNEDDEDFDSFLKDMGLS